MLHRRSEPCGHDVTISACYDWSIASQSTSFHYVIGIQGILPYKHVSRSVEIFSACAVLSHSSIILLPRQPCVFTWLAR